MQSGYKALIHWSNWAKEWVDDNGDKITPVFYQELPNISKE